MAVLVVWMWLPAKRDEWRHPVVQTSILLLHQTEAGESGTSCQTEEEKKRRIRVGQGRAGQSSATPCRRERELLHIFEHKFFKPWVHQSVFCCSYHHWYAAETDNFVCVLTTVMVCVWLTTELSQHPLQPGRCCPPRRCWWHLYTHPAKRTEGWARDIHTTGRERQSDDG